MIAFEFVICFIIEDLPTLGNPIKLTLAIIFKLSPTFNEPPFLPLVNFLGALFFDDLKFKNILGIEPAKNLAKPYVFQ